MIVLRPSSKRAVNALIKQWHRHHPPVRGLRFAVEALVDDEVVGAVVVGRPSAPALDDGTTHEATRLVLQGGHYNVGSRLLGACTRASDAMGCWRCVSYTRDDETGQVFRAAGWVPVAKVKAEGWDRRAADAGRPYLPGLFLPTTEIVDRIRWERHLGGRQQPPALALYTGRE